MGAFDLRVSVPRHAFPNRRPSFWFCILLIHFKRILLLPAYKAPLHQNYFSNFNHENTSAYFSTRRTNRPCEMQMCSRGNYSSDVRYFLIRWASLMASHIMFKGKPNIRSLKYQTLFFFLNRITLSNEANIFLRYIFLGNCT